MDDDFHNPNIILKINDNKVSVTYLQRKFKLSYEMASTVSKVLTELNGDKKTWKDSKEDLPKPMKTVMVEGRSYKLGTENVYDIHIAHLDGRCGWINKETNELLYVNRWMDIPKDK